MSERFRYQVLDISIVAVLNQPTLNIPNPPALFQSEEFEDLLRPPITYSQTLTLDPARGATTAHQFESMASQKSVSVSNFRVEAHDRSGRYNPVSSDLPLLFHKMLNQLNIQEIQALGANYEFQLKAPNNAAQTIAQKLLVNVESVLPIGSQVRGGAARIYFGDDNNSLYTLIVEPRFNDPSTNNIWMSCNYNITAIEAPAVEEVASILGRGYNVIERFAQELFG